ncbi:MAG: fatty acid desaturase [Candidatus Doudnabacteria bacterium]|nr:fatty acid desaturase [Candidatus Doudnabacteria bacterium]
MKYKVNYFTAFFLLLFHVGAVIALFSFELRLLIIAGTVWFSISCLGIGIGYHRLLTHRGFKTPRWFEYTLALCGCLALQGPPLKWVTSHRRHHNTTEKPGKDPHTPRDGVLWAHVGWIIKPPAIMHSHALMQKYSPDLFKSTFYRLLNHYWMTPTALLTMMLWSIGGWQAICWGICVPTVCCWHSTWLVNSAAHRWGYRRYPTHDDSRNNWWVALITHGEGWHNNHHHQPTSAKHGRKWFEFDVNWYVIRILSVFRLTQGLKQR